jgi:hypothetical protein
MLVNGKPDVLSKDDFFAEYSYGNFSDILSEFELSKSELFEISKSELSECSDQC